ncbi:hypothetical protein RS130_17320 [Paraglaciecola aquimarina]|uniref:Uncharacterized protein n=1 Tax=Paraglaciecola aquimarina TaxID=1235557 RepID=A0ABU3SZL3_9ALTE|nr:hypothetical protein [Paraglaciecola aquimarina]MDU0355433.1 hypothetical protein [Paraglaciecola aquimarina]
MGIIVNTVVKLIENFVQAILLVSLKVSFIMSYTYNGTQIRVKHPVHQISVNKHKVAFADKSGQQLSTFSNNSEAKQFVSWLLQSH